MSRSSNPSSAERMLLDAICVGFVGLLVIAAVVFQGVVPRWQETASGLALAGCLYILSAHLVRRMPEGFPRLALSSASVLLLFSYLFQAIAGFQHILVSGWMDSLIISWEKGVTGTESTLLLQKITTPALTEWMMFSYVAYVPLLPAVALLCYLGGGSKGAHEYLVSFAFANVICYCGFILFPVAGPLFHNAAQYTVPLEGGIFASCGEWMRSNVHYPGGSLPSPHCAIGTVMMVMLYRHNRRAFAVLIAPLLTIYAATVYGRYHYTWDVVAGIAAATVTLKARPLLAALFARPVRQARGVFTIENLQGTATTRLQEEQP